VYVFVHVYVYVREINDPAASCVRKNRIGALLAIAYTLCVCVCVYMHVYTYVHVYVYVYVFVHVYVYVREINDPAASCVRKNRIGALLAIAYTLCVNV